MTRDGFNSTQRAKNTVSLGALPVSVSKNHSSMSLRQVLRILVTEDVESLAIVTSPKVPRRMVASGILKDLTPRQENYSASGLKESDKTFELTHNYKF